MMKKIISFLIIMIVFLIGIMFFFFPKQSFSYNENRYLTKFPKITIENILSGNFTTQLDNYIADNFPLRESLLNFKSNLYKKLGVYKQNGVYYGKDNKLYQEYQEPKNNDLIIEKVNALVDKVDSDVYFMLVPTSIYINHDNIPKYNDSFDEGITIDYLKSKLKTHFIDVRETLLKHNNEYLYYGTDHHWTTRGAYLAYQDYCKYLKINCHHYDFTTVNTSFWGTLYSKVLDNSLDYDYIEKINDKTNYSVYFEDELRYSNSLYNDKYLNEKDKYSYFLDNNHSLITIENLDYEGEEDLLIIKDSYANTFIPLIASNYKYIYVIDPRYYNLSITDYINEKQIKNVLFLYNVLTMRDDLGIIGIQ